MTTISRDYGLSYQQLGGHALGVGPAVRLISTTMKVEWKVGLSVQKLYWTLEFGLKLATCKPFNLTHQNGQERRPCRCTEIVLKIGFTQKPYVRVRSVSCSVRDVSPSVALAGRLGWQFFEIGSSIIKCPPQTINNCLLQFATVLDGINNCNGK